MIDNSMTLAERQLRVEQIRDSLVNDKPIPPGPDGWTPSDVSILASEATALFELVNDDEDYICPECEEMLREQERTDD